MKKKVLLRRVNVHNLYRVFGVLSKEFLLATHMIRSPKHLKIFSIVDEGKNGQYKGELVVKENGIEIIMGKNFLMPVLDSGKSIVYEIIQDGKIRYKRVVDAEVEAINLPEIELKGEYRYVGRICPDLDMMIQNKTDQGKVSFKKYSKK